MRIGKNVEKFRNAKGLTQQELADRVYVTQATISYLEKDVKIPGFEVLARIADVLECTTDDFRSETVRGG